MMMMMATAASLEKLEERVISPGNGEKQKTRPACSGRPEWGAEGIFSARSERKRVVCD